jgi:hypothetical protein
MLPWKEPGSRRSRSRMQIDILIEVQPHEVRSSIQTLMNLVLNTDVGCRLVVFMHGAARKTFAELDEFLVQGAVTDMNNVEYPFSWTVAHDQRNLSFNAAHWRLAPLKKNSLAALVAPGTVVSDEKWFGKVQQTFLKDPRNMLTFVLPFTNSSLPPNKAFSTFEVEAPLIMGGIDFPTILESCVGGEANFAKDLQAATKRLGGNRWLINSVRHVTLPCQEPEKSEPETTLFE